MRKPVDTSKKSNIKCEHCIACDKDKIKGYWCCILAKPVNYWNRCKLFSWSEQIKEQKNN